MAGSKGATIQNPVRLIKGEDGIYRAEVWKTKAELTDIYENAHKKPLTEAALDRDIAQTKPAQAPKQINEVDRLIAQGDIRIKDKAGYEIYEYKGRDGTFRSAPTDADAVERVNALKAERAVVKKPKKEIQIPNSMVNTVIDIENRKEVLSNSPYNSLTKYVATRGNNKGVLPEVTGIGKSTFGRKGDDIVDELFGGQKSTEEVRVEFESFAEKKQALLSEEKEINKEVSLFKKSEKEKLSKLEAQQKEKDAFVESQAKKQMPLKKEDTKTLEEMAQQQLGKVDTQMFDKWAALPKSIKVPGTSVQKKIAFYDYLRTPIEVLKKIGLEKQGLLLIKKQDDYLMELPKNIEKITEWVKRAPGEAASKRIFEYLDGKEGATLSGEELKIAGEIKVWFKEWADRLNLPEDNRIASYITHLFDDQFLAKEFDEDLAKIIDDKIAGSVYDPFLEKRLGAKGYKEDAWAALDAYVKRATRKVHMDEALEELEFAAGTLEKSQWKYVKRFADNVNMRPGEVEELFDNAFKKTFGYKLGQRPVIRSLGFMRQMVSRGAFGLNLGTAFRNLSQGINTYAVLGEKYTTIGYTKLFSPSAQRELLEQGILSNGFIQDRVLSSKKQALQKLDKGLFAFMEVAERINRGSAYLGAKAKAIAEGKNEADAIQYAKNIVAKTQFKFGAVDTPVAFNNAISKTLLQFQSYTTKQTEFLAEMVMNKDYAGLLRYSGAGLVFVYTIGQIFGMKPSELLPVMRFETPPTLQLPIEIIKASLNTPDKYNNERTTGEKASDILKSGRLLIPTSSQVKKTYEGIQANIEQGSYSKDGKLQFETGLSTGSKIQNALFGKYASGSAQNYFNRVENSEKAKNSLDPVYKNIQSLKAEGKNDEAIQIYDELSEGEKEIYQQVKKNAVREQTTQSKREILPVFQEIRNLKDAGKVEEAIARYDSLSEEQKKYYQMVKKDRDTLAKTIKSQESTESSSPERGIVDTVVAYADAFATDPANAWKAMTTKEVLGKVQGNLVELQRFYSKDFNKEGGSEEYIKNELARLGIPFSQRDQYRLEHIIPVKAGGSTDPENLVLISTELHDSYTSFDIALSKAVQESKMTRNQATELAIRFKSGKTTKAEALNQIKKVYNK